MSVRTEAERQFYLASAGISLWYARTPLPGSAPSPEFDFAEPAEVVQPAPELDDAPRPSPREQARKQTLAAIQGLVSKPAPGARAPATRDGHERTSAHPVTARALEEVIPNVGISSGVAPEVISAGVPGAVSDDAVSGPAVREPVEASWGFWIAERFVLVSALSPDASAKLQDALAVNILTALGAEVSDARQLHWPVFSNPAVTGNDEVGLKALLKELFGEFGERRVIALGIMPVDSWPARAAWLADVSVDPAVDFAYSLAALSADPARKRTLWHELRALKEAPG